MQTNTSRGMQTMEQALADLTMRRKIAREAALAATSKQDEFEAVLERSGFGGGSDEHLPETLRGFNLVGAEQ